jgi:hypothetical protein
LTGNVGDNGERAELEGDQPVKWVEASDPNGNMLRE